MMPSVEKIDSIVNSPAPKPEKKPARPKRKRRKKKQRKAKKKVVPNLVLPRSSPKNQVPENRGGP